MERVTNEDVTEIAGFDFLASEYDPLA